MWNLQRIVALALAIALATVFVGCKAAPAEKQSQFLGQEHKLYRDAGVECWHRVWADENFKEWERFKKIYFPPVNTDYVEKMNWWDHVNTDINRESSCKELADYMRKEFIDAQKENPDKKHRLQVVDKPDAETVVIQLAITEVVPTKVWLNLSGYTFLWMALEPGRIAMEGKIIDGKDNKVIGMFMDREQGRMSIVNVKDLTWYSHAKSIITEWAEQGVALVNAEEGDVVEDSCPFTLLPW